jgi:hypothetical protein
MIETVQKERGALLRAERFRLVEEFLSLITDVHEDQSLLLLWLKALRSGSVSQHHAGCSPVSQRDTGQTAATQLRTWGEPRQARAEAYLLHCQPHE